jgi:uncharacterized protein
MLIGAPGTSLSAGGPGSLLGALRLWGLPSPVLPQESRAFRSNQHLKHTTFLITFKEKNMAFLYRFSFFIIGLFILTLGICLTIKANLGAGAWDALNVALTERIGLTVGTWVMIDGAVILFVNAYLVKRKPEFLTLITIVVIGLLVDFWLLIVFDTWSVHSFVLQFITLISGILTVGLGASIYLQAKFPASPIDNLMLAIRERFKVNLTISKTIGEIAALIPAFLLKGPIGLGTIIITFAIGPSIQLFFPHFEKLMNSLLAKEKKLQEKF